MSAASARARLEAELLPRLPTTGWALDRLYRDTSAAFARRPAPDGSWPPLSQLDPGSVRRADVAVVVASGPSALRLADPAVAGDPRYDFFALNHAGALPVPARLYSVEDPVLKGRQQHLSRADAVGLLLWAIRSGRALATGAPVVVRGGWDDPATTDLAAQVAGLGAPVHLAPRFALPVRGRGGPERYARWASRRQPFRWPQGSQPVLSPRGGLGFFVSLCIGLGYRRIVLAGVDMYSDEYFFDRWEGDPVLDRLRAGLGAPTDAPHPTAVTTGARPPVGSLLVALDRHLLRPQGRALLVGDRSSRLFPALALHDWG